MKKPSISELTSLLDKPALVKWANQQGLKGIDISKDRERRLTAGISRHKQIEDWWRMKIPFIDPELDLNYHKFTEDKTIFDMEGKIETEWFTGRYDAKIEIKGKIYICDFKSTKGIYLENILQLVGYSMAEKHKELAVIHIPSFTMIDLKLADTEPYEEILIALANIYYQKQKLISIT